MYFIQTDYFILLFLGELIFAKVILHCRTSPSQEFLHNWWWPCHKSLASFYHPKDLKGLSIFFISEVQWWIGVGDILRLVNTSLSSLWCDKPCCCLSFSDFFNFIFSFMDWISWSSFTASIFLQTTVWNSSEANDGSLISLWISIKQRDR